MIIIVYSRTPLSLITITLLVESLHILTEKKLRWLTWISPYVHNHSIKTQTLVKDGECG